MRRAPVQFGPWSCLCGLSLVLFAPTRAFAEEAPARAALVVRKDGSGCFAARDLAAAVELRLGRQAFVERERADVVVEVASRPAPPGSAVTLTLRSQSGGWLGARDLVSDERGCAGLRESVPLVLALMIDLPKDELLSRQAAAPPASEEPPPPRPLRVPAPAPRPLPPAHARSEAPRYRVETTISALVSWGLLPEVRPGARLALTLFPPEFWATELGLSGFLRAPAETDGQGAKFRALSADLSVCPVRSGSARVRMMACLTQSVGQLAAEGFGFADDRKHERLLYALGLGARASWALSKWFAVRADLSAEAPVTRDDFYYRSSAGTAVSVYRLPPVFALAGLGLQLGFE